MIDGQTGAQRISIEYLSGIRMRQRQKGLVGEAMFCAGECQPDFKPGYVIRRQSAMLQRLCDGIIHRLAHAFHTKQQIGAAAVPLTERRTIGLINTSPTACAAAIYTGIEPCRHDARAPESR